MPYYDFKNLSPEKRAMYEQAAILENSAIHQARVEAERIAFAESEKQKAENEKLAAQHLEHSRRQREAEAEQKRKEQAARFEQNLREQFFAGNPHASESDYLNVKDELKKRAMLANVDSADRSEEVSKTQVNYNVM